MAKFIENLKSNIRDRLTGPSEQENEAASNQKQFESALNDTKFMDEMETHPNLDIADLDPSNPDDVEKLLGVYESYKVKAKTSADLKALYRKQIKEDIGIDIPAADMDFVDTYLNQEFLDNPEAIAELAEQVAEFNASQKEIDAQERVLRNLGGDLEALKEKEEAMAEAQATSGFMKTLWNPKRAKEAKAGLDKHGVKVGQLEKELDKIRTKIDKGETATEQLEALREEFAETRKRVLKELGPIAELTAMARTKAQERMDALTDPAIEDSTRLDTARSFFDKLEGSEYDKETSIDYYDDHADFETRKQAVDSRVEVAVRKEIKNAVDGLASKTLKEMQRVLGKFFEKNQIGSKRGQEARDFVLNYLKVDLLPAISTDKAKTMLIKTILVKYEA